MQKIDVSQTTPAAEDPVVEETKETLASDAKKINEGKQAAKVAEKGDSIQAKGFKTLENPSHLAKV